MTCLFKSERKDACPDRSGCWSWGFGVSYLRGAEPPEQARPGAAVSSPCPAAQR